MKLAWLFGPTLEQRHLLYVYLSVWIIQGGYFTWIVAQWLRTRRASRTAPTSSALHRNSPS